MFLSLQQQLFLILKKKALLRLIKQQWMNLVWEELELLVILVLLKILGIKLVCVLDLVPDLLVL